MAVDEFTFRAMASHVHVIVVDGPPQSGAVAEALLAELEAAWSRFIDTSDVNRLNHAAGRPVGVSRATLTLVDVMVCAWRTTRGRFDPTILPALLDAGYVASVEDPSACTRLPAPVDGRARGSIAIESIELNDHDRTITLPAGLAIDPGGIGKGLAADLAVAELLARGASGALVSIGGDLAAAGTPSTGEGWAIDIEDPVDQTDTLAHFTLSGGGVATSSTQTRRWMTGSGQQHHVIDPTTRYPSSTDLVAVTVVAPCGWQAEVHATTVLLDGSGYFDDHRATAGLEAVGVMASGEILATAGLAPTVAIPAGTVFS